VTIALTAMLEARASDPLIDFTLLRRRVFASANASLVLSFLALFAVSFVMPFYLEELRGYSALDTGMLLTPLPLTLAVVAPFAGALADRVGTRWLAAIGLTIACAGLFLLAGLSATATPWEVIWRLIVIGVGQGLFQSPNNSALMGAAPRQQQGLAAGFMATGRVVGQSMSVALAGAVLGAYSSTSAGATLVRLRDVPKDRIALGDLQQTFLTGFHAAFVVCGCVAACGILTSLVRGQEQRTGRA
jgi:MFS family permease